MCYCTDCVTTRTTKQHRYPFTSGDDIFITSPQGQASHKDVYLDPSSTVRRQTRTESTVIPFRGKVVRRQASSGSNEVPDRLKDHKDYKGSTTSYRDDQSANKPARRQSSTRISHSKSYAGDNGEWAREHLQSERVYWTIRERSRGKSPSSHREIRSQKNLNVVSYRRHSGSPGERMRDDITIDRRSKSTVERPSNHNRKRTSRDEENARQGPGNTANYSYSAPRESARSYHSNRTEETRGYRGPPSYRNQQSYSDIIVIANFTFQYLCGDKIPLFDL